MAQKAIREFESKRMLAKYWTEYFGTESRYECNAVLVTPETDIDDLKSEYEWLNNKRLVVKPDQLFGKRGKNNLVLINASIDVASNWIEKKKYSEITIGEARDNLTYFLVEEFVPHTDEYFVAITSERDADKIMLSAHGGLDIEDLWSTIQTIQIPVLEDMRDDAIESQLPLDIPKEQRRIVSRFIKGLFQFYRDFGFTYLEINPFVLSANTVIPLDMVARLDDTAHFKYSKKWGDIEFPPPFGRKLYPEGQFIETLDKKSGASLKLTILNPSGRIWTIVAGGGASVIYTDTIVNLGFGEEVANYGEYSGNPSTDETYEYVKTILGVMCREKDPLGKVLIVGGGIANFTDISATFEGFMKAFEDYSQQLIDHKISIYVRRGGPNYKTGLKNLDNLGKKLNLDMYVHGPELHMTRIVKMALGKMGKRNA
jgi:ATP-citrate lyase beta-subunit